MKFLDEIIPQDYPNFSELGKPACAEADPESFFPEELPDGQISRRAVYPREKEAKAVCRECPYIYKCLEYALKNPELIGIWGGTTDSERTSLRRYKRVSLKVRPR